jgi:hypothetical protein
MGQWMEQRVGVMIGGLRTRNLFGGCETGFTIAEGTPAAGRELGLLRKEGADSSVLIYSTK